MRKTQGEISVFAAFKPKCFVSEKQQYALVQADLHMLIRLSNDQKLDM